MIFYKIWIETRLRALMLLGILLWMLYQMHANGRLASRPGPMLAAMPVFWFLAPLMLAGAGLRTECAFRMQKGQPGSVFYTLALPVSRMWLFTARAAMTLALSTLVVAAALAVAWAMPEIRAHGSIGLGAEYLVSVVACIFPALGVGTLASVYLDQQWQQLPGLAVLGGIWFAFSRLPGLERFDPFRAIGAGSVLAGHAMPWAAMGVAVAIGGVLLAGAARAVERLEF